MKLVQMQLFRTRAPKNGENKVLAMLHEAQTGSPGGGFSVLFNLPLGSLGS